MVTARLPQDDIEFLAKRVRMGPLYGRIPGRFVEFGDSAGEPKYERVLQIPETSGCGAPCST